METKQSNINNLISLWTKVSIISGKYLTHKEVEYGFVPDSQWPNRIWTQNNYDNEIVDSIELLLLKNSPQLTYSYFESNDKLPEFKSNRIQLKSKQYGMSLILNKKFENGSRLTLKKVNTQNDIDLWCQHFEASFKYYIQPKSIELTMSIVEYFNIWHNETMIGTVVLYITGEVAGIHSLGILPSMRGNGYAREAMHLILNRTIAKGSKVAVLQASEMAKSMYLNMGFQQDFIMYNFKNTES